MYGSMEPSLRGRTSSFENMGNAESGEAEAKGDDPSSGLSSFFKGHKTKMIILAPHQHPSTTYLQKRLPSNFVVVADGDDARYFKPGALADVEREVRRRLRKRDDAMASRSCAAGARTMMPEM